MRLVAAIVAVGTLLRLAWALSAAPAPVNDTLVYRDLALSLASGQGFSLDGAPTAWYVPLWPAWMAVWYALGLGDVGVRVASALLGGATIALTYALGSRLFGRRSGLAAAGMIALYPGLVVLPGPLLTENLFIPAAVAVLLLTLRVAGPRSALLLGLAIGALSLVREVGWLFAVAAALYWLAVRLPARVLMVRSAAMLAGLLLVLTPWTVRNAVVVGVPGLSTTGAVNLYVAFYPEGDGDWFRPGWLNADVYWPPPERDEPAIYHYGRESGIGFASARPDLILSRAPGRLSQFALNAHWPLTWNDHLEGWSPAPLSLLVLSTMGWHWMLLPLAALGIMRGRGNRESWLLLALVVVFAVTHAMLYGSGRFHAPLMPALAVLAATPLRRSLACRQTPPLPRRTARPPPGSRRSTC